MATPRCPVTQWAGSRQIGGMSGTIRDVEDDNEHDDDDDDDDNDDDDDVHMGTIEMCGSVVSDKGVLS